jgi:hypothetical protein
LYSGPAAGAESGFEVQFGCGAVAPGVVAEGAAAVHAAAHGGKFRFD